MNLIIDKYRAANVQANATGPNYYGFTDAQGQWFIMKETIAGDLKDYTFIKGTTGYAANWAGRTGLSYALYNGLH